MAKKKEQIEEIAGCVLGGSAEYRLEIAKQVYAKGFRKVIRCKDCTDRNTEGCPLAYWNGDQLVSDTEDNSFCCFARPQGKCNEFTANGEIANVVSKSEFNKLEYTLMGVMHSVDKWLDGDELKQDEVNRAATMREKTLRIVEEKQEKIDIQNKEIERLRNILLRFTSEVQSWSNKYGIDTSTLSMIPVLECEKESIVTAVKEEAITETRAEVDTLKKERDALKQRLNAAEECINKVDDALCRGSGNDWAEECIENYHKQTKEKGEKQ